MKHTLKITALLLAAWLLFLTAGCAGNAEEPVGSCGPYEILYEELRYHTLRCRDENPGYTEEELQAAVKQALAEQYAVLELAAEYLPDRSPESESMQALVEEAIAGAKESMGGKSAFKDYLEQSYLTEHLMRRLLAITQMEIELENRLFAGTELEDEEAMLAWLDDGNYVRVRRISLPLTDADGNPMREQAEALRLELMNAHGAAPDSLITPALTAAGVECAPAEFLFRGMADEQLTDAALALFAVGDVSGVLETAEGYCILVRVEDDRETLEEYQLPDILDRCRAERMEELIATAAAELSVSWNEYGSGLLLTGLE